MSAQLLPQTLIYTFLVHAHRPLNVQASPGKGGKAARVAVAREEPAALADAILRYHYYIELGVDAARHVAPFREVRHSACRLRSPGLILRCRLCTGKGCSKELSDSKKAQMCIVLPS